MMYLDLEELSTVFSPYLLWSAKRPAIAWFKRSDHLGDKEKSLAECVKDLIEERAGVRPNGPIRLLTHLRYFGYCMNPVSLFFCWNHDETKLEHVVAEVSNTPWKERHCYVLSYPAIDGVNATELTLNKEFHVSPFMPMNQEYSWKIDTPGKDIRVQIETYENSIHKFNASLFLSGQPITRANLMSCLMRYPLMTIKVILTIHWQALRLWMKRIQIYPHPARNKCG